jgi:RHS repeat-associated protein
MRDYESQQLYHSLVKKRRRTGRRRLPATKNGGVVMKKLCPNFWLLPIHSIVALTAIMLAIWMNSRVFAQDAPAKPFPLDGLDPANGLPVGAPISLVPTVTAPSGTVSTASATGGTGNASDYDGPVGVSGIFNGNVTSGCSYDPLTHNATRAIDDIVVPGSIGKYPLKMTRYFNSRGQYYSTVGLGPGWNHEYGWMAWTNGRKVICPKGTTYDNLCPTTVAVDEKWDPPSSNGTGTFRLADGGKVVFVDGSVTSIIDPHGQPTNVAYINVTLNGVLFKVISTVTEPGGRYLKFIFGGYDVFSHFTVPLLTRVEAYDGPANHLIDWVNYVYTLQDPGGSGSNKKCLTQVNYSDGTSATYTYRSDNVPESPTVPPYTFKFYPLVASCDDVRYNGPMRQIDYDYNSGPHGMIVRENNKATGDLVSKILPDLTFDILADPPNNFTETRGDGPTRSFHYTKFRLNRSGEPSGPCPDLNYPEDPEQQILKDYTDFEGHTTYIDHDSNWRIKAVHDARSASAIDDTYKTTYTRQLSSWGITQITHPDGTHVDQTFWPNNSQTDPWYLASRTDEHGNTTTYTRDSNNRVTLIQYQLLTPQRNPLDLTPGAVSESFTYNNFGQVLTHHMTNGAWKKFAYDTRGLLTDEWVPKVGSVPLDTDPHIHYDYYTSGPWIDRLMKKTLPPNASGQVAYDIYDYDRAYVNGENRGLDPVTAPISGRGLVTRITHADNTYQSFSYDIYGNKLWQQDELRHPTTFTHDQYKRILTTKDALNHTTTNSYIPTGLTNSDFTTSPLPFSVTLPSTKKTNTYYDDNWRKTRVQQAPGTADEANTYFTYDNVGNVLTVKAPRNATLVTRHTYDARNRLLTTTDELNYTTTIDYDDSMNHDYSQTETRPPVNGSDGEVIISYFDALNRVWEKTVKRSATTIDTVFMAYDNGSNLETFRDEDSHDYTYLYDASNRRTKMTYPDTTKHEDTVYDNVGNAKTYTNRAGSIQTFTYDNRNRQIYFTWNNTPATTQSTGYDDASRVSQTVNSMTPSGFPSATSTINYTYSNDNRLNTEEEWTSAFGDNVHRTKTYTYDVDGNRLTIQYPSGSIFNYTYTNRNQVLAIKSGTTSIATYTYDPSGNITNCSRNNGTSTAYTVDAVNRDTAVVHTLVGTTRRFDYAYNAVNDITAVQRDSGLGDGYLYDYTQQITAYQQNGTVNLTTGIVTGAATTNNMVFDGCGNRTSLNGVTQTFNNMNQPTIGVTYGTGGNLSTYNGWTYTYDVQYRLTKAVNGSTTAYFYYDGKNRQVARSINGVVTLSVWDDWELIEEYGTGNVITAKYLQGAHGPIKDFVNNNIYYYQDSLGSTSHIASSTGALLESYRYNLNGTPTYWDAAGTQLSASAYGIRDLFTGERYVTEIGLYDLRNRYYSPALGRFLQPDPIGFKGDASNLYRYCGNDWANRTDPMGLEGPPDDPRDGRNRVAQPTRGETEREARERLGYGASKLGPDGSNAGQRAKTQTDRPSPPGFWHDRDHPDPDGLVPMNSEMKRLITSGLRDSNVNGNEINRAVWVNPNTKKLTPSTGSTGSTPFQGGQQGFPPRPPKNSGLLVAADMHGHNFPPGHSTGNEQPGGHDFRHGNYYLVPVGVRSPTGAIYIYRAHVWANPGSSNMDGKLEGPL